MSGKALGIETDDLVGTAERLPDVVGIIWRRIGCAG